MLKLSPLNKGLLILVGLCWITTGAHFGLRQLAAQNKQNNAAAPAAAVTQGDPGAENLKRCFQQLMEAVQLQDNAKAGQLAKAFFPDRKRLRVALTAKITDELMEKILAQNQGFIQEAGGVGVVFGRHDPTQVKVFGATVAQLANDANTADVFPGGAVNLAKRGVFQPDLTFYEIQAEHTTFHLFYWDGKAWAMLGPFWRILK